MLETPNYPAIYRVMRVQPRPDEKPASGFSWGDYEDVRIDGAASGSGTGIGNDVDADREGDEDDNDGWGVVKSRGRASTFLFRSSLRSYSYTFSGLTILLLLPPPKNTTRPHQPPNHNLKFKPPANKQNVNVKTLPNVKLRKPPKRLQKRTAWRRCRSIRGSWSG